jgi:hypothetical protein
MFFFHYNKYMFVHWSCTFCVLVLVPLFHILDLDLYLFFHYLFL